MISKLIILGGGPAGMAAAWFAHQAGIMFDLYEASGSIGGNARTVRHGDFLFDTGAHRIHDVYPAITEVIKEILQDDLLEIDVPSQIYSNQSFINFPFTPLDLLQKLGVKEFSLASFNLLKQKLRRNGHPAIPNFQDQSIRKYGMPLADKFLLKYSEKLWGLPAEELSPSIAGQRLRGLNLRNIAGQFMGYYDKRNSHLDGKFYYPKYGIGSLFKRMEKIISENNIHLNARITGLKLKRNAISALEINSKTLIEVEAGSIVINTLPLNFTVNMLQETLPVEVIRITQTLKFRDILLICFFLRKESVSKNASVYFPDKEIPFTRVVEPRNRSTFMSPPGYTSLIVEWPCFKNNTSWNLSAEELTGNVKHHLLNADLLKEQDILDSAVYKMCNAYPVLEAGFEKKTAKIADAVSAIKNMKLTGRNGSFSYVHIHDLMQEAKSIIDENIMN